MKAIERALAAVIDGDLDALPLVLATDQVDLLGAAITLPQLTITKSALIRVLTAWRNCDDYASHVQQWASFVRRGYVSGNANGPVQRIDIDYDTNNEELIAEILGRLDEIGDVIDGEVDADELQNMLIALSS